ncbi:MAG: hypothetical protein R8G66_22370 [Cytophagales bacterium]|nr:hypothetical protein [Cytophagales bacterium]
MEHFTQILKLIYKNSLWLVIFPTLAAFALHWLTRNERPVYEVEAKMMMAFQENKNISLGDQDVKQYQIHTYFQNAIELARSKKLIEKVRIQIAQQSISDTLNLFPFPWPDSLQEELRIALNKRGDGTMNFDARSRVNQVIGTFFQEYHLSHDQLRKSLLAFRVMDSHFLQMKLKYDDPYRANFLLRSMIEQLQNELGQLSKSSIVKHRQVIEELVRKAKKDLDEKVHVLEAMKVKNNIINLGEHTKAIVTYLVQLEGIRADVKARIAAQKELGGSIKAGMATEEFVTQYRQENMAIDQSRQALYDAQSLKLSHLKNTIDVSEILRQQQLINDHQSTIRNGLTDISRSSTYDPNKIYTSLALRYINATLDVDQLQQELTIVEREIKRVNGYSARFAPFESTIGTMTEEINTARQTYLLLLNKLNLTESMELGSSESRLAVIDHPEIPGAPIPSKRIFIILGGAIAVFVVLAVLFIILFLINDSIQDVGTFERRFGETALAALPASTQSKDRLFTSSLKYFQLEEVKKVLAEIRDSKIITINALSAREDTMPVAEALKQKMEGEDVDVLDLRQAEDEADVVRLMKQRSEMHNQVLVLPPPLQYSYDGLALAEASDCNLLTFGLGRVKTSADKRIMKLFEAPGFRHLGMVLTNLKPEHMEGYVGGIPKQRNWFRRIVKKIIQREW